MEPNICRSAPVQKFYRLDYSEYFSKSFRELEVTELLKIRGLTQANSPKEANIIITNSDTTVDNIPTSANLVIHPNSGYDRFSLEWLKSRDIPVIVGSPIRQIAVSEYYLSAIFHHFTSIPKYKNWDNERQWPRSLISEKSVLILGEGHIGTYLRNALSPICKNVKNYDPFKYPESSGPELDKYNIIITAFGLNPSTKNFIDQSFLNKCKPDLLLLHASRGKQIVMEDLKKFLDTNKNAFAYVDVFPKEPYDYKKIDSNNIICSSHIAGVYSDIEESLVKFERDLIENFINMPIDDFLKKYKQQNLNERRNHSFLI
tara:strand:+ start:917 stop:1864 length:948 start_codon:yes stop_codon:yes gene_type:complete